MKVAATFLLAVTVLAHSAAEAVAIRGSRSCGTWTADREKKGFGAIATEAWVLGYLSGLASMSGKDILQGIDNDSITLWLDNYCRANPLDRLFEGADNLYLEIIKRKGL